MAQKERHFFGRDLRPERYDGPHTRLDWYLSFFEGCTTEKRVGEASVWYLASQTAAQEIKAFAPDADIIIMLRNPVEMMYSLYNMFRWVNDLTPGGVIDARTEKPLTFEEALATQEARKQQFLEQSPHPDYVIGKRELRLFHTDAAMYHDQVSRYLDCFGADHVKVILYEDFKANTEGVYRDVLRFLGVDAEVSVDLQVYNSNRQIKSQRLHRRLFRNHHSFGMLRTVGRKVVPRRFRKRIFRALMDLNVDHRPRPMMSPEVRTALAAQFKPEIERLSQLIGRDLTAHWR